MNRVLLFCGLFTVALGTAALAATQAPGVFGAASPSRQAEDRRVDESARQTQTARQTEAPKAGEKPSAPPAKSEPTPAFQRQAEPQRQAEAPRQHEPQRQREPRRQAEPPRPSNTGHWDDPGPAWRPLGPAWRDVNNLDGRRQPDSRRRDRTNGSNTYYGYPYVAFGYAPYVEFAAEPSPEPAATVTDEPPLGFLQLRVQPRSAEVYVDGALAGTVDDFGGRGARQVPAGPRRVEIVAPGYETLTFDVRVPENDTVTFTRELEPAVERPSPAPAVIPHKALYVVPQCYIGDRMPLPTDMPAGCRVENVRMIP